MGIEAQILRKCFHDFYCLGLTTSSGGNVSCRTSDGLICISPSQIDKGFLKEDDFASLTSKSEVIGEHKPSMEYPFHLMLYNRFPEISTVLHFHPPIFVALSLLNENDPKLLEVLNKFRIGYSRYAIPGSDKLGQEICNAVEEGFDFVLMQNHGMLAVGKNVDDLCEKIIALNNALITFFNLKEINKTITPKGVFKEKVEQTNRFYEKRAGYFLSLENEIKFEFVEIQNVFYSTVQLPSLKRLNVDNFKTTIIPESYLLLKNTKLQDVPYSTEIIAEYLRINEFDVFLFPEGRAVIKGKSLYNLYDRMEVLDFTAKVLLCVNEMGSCQLLTDAQVQALELQFFN